MTAPGLLATGLSQLPSEVLLRILDMIAEATEAQAKARLCLESCCKELQRSLRDKVWTAVYLGSAKAARWAVERKPITQKLIVDGYHCSLDKAALKEVLEVIVSESLKLFVDSFSGVEQLSAAFPALRELSCGFVNLSQLSGSLPALTKLEFCSLWGIEQLSATFPALRELWLLLEQYSGSFPALVEVDCGNELRECNYEGDYEYGDVLLGRYGGSFPALARVGCYFLDLGQYSGSFPALVELDVVRGVRGLERDMVFPVLRKLRLCSRAALPLQPPHMPPGLTELACHVSMFPEVGSARQLERLDLWSVKRNLPEGLEAAARLKRLSLSVVPVGDEEEVELSQQALTTLALLKLQHSLKEVVVEGSDKRFSRGQYVMLAAMGLCQPPHDSPHASHEAHPCI
ncbi:hypothetical protein N2152v2_002881 [Parachlorella kessleri]